MQKVDQESEELMTKRMTISIDDDVYNYLKLRARKEVRSEASMAAALITIVAREDTETYNQAQAEPEQEKQTTEKK